MCAGTVFIVDDDEAVRDSLGAMLGARDLRVRAFGSGAAFLEAYDSAWQGVLLLDVKMPIIDGRELQRRLRARGCRLPIIFITGHGDISMAVQAMKEGAADFIEKPIDPDDLLTRMETHLNATPGDMAGEVADPAARERFEQLTPREKEVMRLVVAGRPNKVVAYELGISPRTVELHRARVMEKMGVRNLASLVRVGLQLGMATE
jgi:two-component system response regulator DctR